MFFSSGFMRRAFSPRLLAIAALAGIAACTVAPKVVAPPAPVAQTALPPAPPAGHPLDKDMPDFLSLPNLAQGATPVRVGVMLPFSSSAAGTRALAQSMLKAAELALFDAGNRNVLLMPVDEGNTPAETAAAANKLMAQGAEVIVGPLFGASVSTVAPIARDRAVPVLAFSTEKAVAGKGVYLISFMPQNEVARVVSYAASQGRSQFAALVPRTAYGDLAADALQDAVTATNNAKLVDVEHFTPTTAAAMQPAAKIAKSGADAVLIAQGGTILRAIAPTLSFNGMDKGHVKLLGTGLWDDDTLSREATLEGGWYAAPEPNADTGFIAKYRSAYGAAPAQIASLAYDAVSLVALLANGTPYHRFTIPALMDPNGFAGVTGIFRFNVDGTSERGLAVLEMAPGGPMVVSPAPKTFQHREASARSGKVVTGFP